MHHLDEDASSTPLHRFDQSVRAAAELEPNSRLQNQQRTTEATQVAEALEAGATLLGSDQLSAESHRALVVLLDAVQALPADATNSGDLSPPQWNGIRHTARHYLATRKPNPLDVEVQQREDSTPGPVQKPHRRRWLIRLMTGLGIGAAISGQISARQDYLTARDCVSSSTKGAADSWCSGLPATIDGHLYMMYGGFLLVLCAADYSWFKRRFRVLQSYVKS